MRISVVFLTGILLGAAIASSVAQDQKLPGRKLRQPRRESPTRPSFDEALTFYTQKMGLEGSVHRQGCQISALGLHAGEPQYVFGDAASQRECNKGLNHYSLHVQEPQDDGRRAQERRGVTVTEPQE